MARMQVLETEIQTNLNRLQNLQSDLANSKMDVTELKRSNLITQETMKRLEREASTASASSSSNATAVSGPSTGRDSASSCGNCTNVSLTAHPDIQAIWSSIGKVIQALNVANTSLTSTNKTLDGLSTLVVQTVLPDVQNLFSQLTLESSKIAGLTTSLSNVMDDLDTLDMKVDTDIEALNISVTNVAQLADKNFDVIRDMYSDLDLTSSRLTRAQNDLENVTNIVTENKETITRMASDVASFDARIRNVQNTLDTTKADLDEVEDNMHDLNLQSKSVCQSVSD